MKRFSYTNTLVFIIATIIGICLSQNATSSIDTTGVSLMAIPSDGDFSVTIVSDSNEKVRREEWSPYAPSPRTIFTATTTAKGSGYVHFTIGTAPKAAQQIGKFGKDDKGKLIWEPELYYVTIQAAHHESFPAFTYDGPSRIRGKVASGAHSQTMSAKMGTQSLAIFHGGGGSAAIAIGQNPALIIGSTTNWSIGALAVNWGNPTSHTANWNISVTKTTENVSCNNDKCTISVSTANEHEKPHAGCNHLHYWCSSDDAEKHRLRTCDRRHGRSQAVCGESYRKCDYDGVDVNDPNYNRCRWGGFHSEISSIESPVVSPTPADGTPNCPDCTSHCSSPCSCTNSGTCNGTVSYHACGNHETSVSGDHSLQASCSSTDSNGNSCTVTSFYACDGHTHSYPVPTVVCPAHSWTSCGGTVSHATTCGSGHTYYTCNPEAVSAHIGHIAVVCPAHSWTSCAGTVSHATTCGSGHTYYACNPSAVSWHVTSRTCTRPNCGSTYTNCTKGDGTCTGGRYTWHN